MSLSCETLSQKSRAPSASCCVLLNFSESSTRTRYDCDGEERSNVSVDRGWRDGSRGGWGRTRRARASRRRAGWFARTSSIVTARSSAMVACRATVTLPRSLARRKLVECVVVRDFSVVEFDDVFEKRPSVRTHLTRHRPPRRPIMSFQNPESPSPRTVFTTGAGAAVPDPSPGTMDRTRTHLDALETPPPPRRVRPPLDFHARPTTVARPTDPSAPPPAPRLRAGRRAQAPRRRGGQRDEATQDGGVRREGATPPPRGFQKPQVFAGRDASPPRRGRPPERTTRLCP